MPALIAGTMAPRFALENVASGDQTAPNYDRWTLIAFYKGTCPTCQLAMPYIEAYETYASGVLEVFALRANLPADSDSQDTVRIREGRIWSRRYLLIEVKASRTGSRSNRPGVFGCFTKDSNIQERASRPLPAETDGTPVLLQAFIHSAT